jgi:hypothetical protein
LDTQEIIRTAREFGLKINNLDNIDDKILSDLRQAIIEFKENRCNIHTVDYMW